MIRLLPTSAPTSGLSSFVGQLAVNMRVFVPTQQGTAVVFAPFTHLAHDADLTFPRASTTPKEAVLPQCETLLTYSRAKDPEDRSRVTLTLDPTPVAKDTVVLGCRPCDARGFAVLDRPYTKGVFKDPYYTARREKLCVITLTCDTPCTTCFCHWVGSGPHDPTGSDILMTAIDGGFVLEAMTEKGCTLLETTGLDTADDHALAALHTARAQATAQFTPAPDWSAVPERLRALFDNTDFWQKQTAHCLACGACTYFCPTCYCFTMTDEGDGLTRKGKRLRTWDTCMASHFTREASGHNPRHTKALRMRNRILHKFSYYPTVWKGVFSCNGCGRCISQCPVHLDIRAVVNAAFEYQEQQIS